MSVSQINQDQVNLVCDNLVKAGTRPTAAAVRAVVGSGSQQTILKYLAVWKEKRPEPISTVLPTEIALMLNRHIADSIEGTTVELQLQVVDAVSDRDAIAAELEQAQVEIKDLSKSKAEAERVAKASEESARIAKLHLSQAQEKILETTIRAADAESKVAGLNEKIWNAKLEQKDLSEELDATKKKLFMSERQNTDLDRKVVTFEKVSNDLAELRSKFFAIGRENSALLRDKEDVRFAESVAAKATANLNSAAREIENMKKELEKARAETKVAEAKASELRGQLMVKPKSKAKPVTVA